MKETINANIGSLAFTLDCDAYEKLKEYFDDIRRRLPEGDTETLDDIECRIAEIFREKVNTPMRVVTLDIVQEAIERMGAPADFGEPRADARTEEPRIEEPRRCLRRSRKDRSIAGICGGIAEFFDADPTSIRLATLLLILFGGLSVWLYILLWIVLPSAPETENNN